MTSPWIKKITQIIYEIIERSKDLNQVVLVGIKTRRVQFGLSRICEATGSVFLVRMAIIEAVLKGRQ